jgi:hypothetical protein
MKVIARISRWDLVRMNFDLLPRLKVNWISALVLSAAFFAVLSYTTREPLTTGVLTRIFLASLAGGFVAILAGAAICLIYVLAIADHKTGVLGEHEYEIRSDGLFEKTRANEGLNKWSGIQSVTRSRAMIHVRINSFLFHVIPRREFASDDEFDRYFELLRQRWQSAA